MNKDEMKQKLAILKQLESSGGKNRVHAMQKDGIHKGTRAVSSYGLMPNTIAEFVKRNKAFQNTPVGKEILASMGKAESINKVTEDESKDDVLAEALLGEQKERLSKHLDATDDPELLNVYAHRRGVSGAIKAAKDDSYLLDPYVKAYKEKKTALPKPEETQEPPKDERFALLKSMLSKKK